jgi:hypothetical protein
MTTDNTGATGAADDLDLFEAEATGQPVTKSETKPSKYEGKSVDDLIQMHQNAEKLISRQGAEVAQVRRMADEILQLKKPTTEVKQIAHQPVTVETLLNDPEKALTSAVNSSELAVRATRAEARVDSLERKLSEQDFVTKHSSFADDVSNPEFITWTQKNEVRRTLGAAAAANNFEAAKNLWDMWEEHKELVGAKTTDTKAKAKVPTGVRQSSTELTSTGKPNLSRSKLMELRAKVEQGDPAAVARWKDPEFQRRMITAYAEDRVK